LRKTLKIKGCLFEYSRGLLLTGAGAAEAPGRTETAILCGTRYLAANMDHYNIRVNVTFRLVVVSFGFQVVGNETAPEPYVAYADAAIYPAHKCVLQEARESESRLVSVLRLV
jgi:hypothetical protein